MRSADATTLLRVAMIILAAYLVLARYDPWVTIAIIAVAMLLDAVDGYFAVREAGSGAVGIRAYAMSLAGDAKSRELVKRYKGRARSKAASFGPRIDVAGDRAVEYILWVVYTYVNVIPLFVIILVILRHSFADAVMAAKGTSSKMKTRFARIVYSSNLFRGGINVVKFLTFSYLALVYVSGYPAWIGYVLVTILVAYIMVRGAAEIYEAYNS